MSYSRYRLLFGDLHGHSNLSLCGVCMGRDLSRRDCYVHIGLADKYRVSRDVEESIDDFYSHARDKAKLDFAALTDHDFSMSSETWSLVCRKASEWYSPGRFATFAAYEWTSRAYGHRNVYFLSDQPPIFRCVDYGSRPSLEKGRSPHDLWRFLERRGVKAITVPHHPPLTQFPVDWRYYSPRFDRVVEIVSIWGVFEYYGNPYFCLTSDRLPRASALDALERGYRLGFIGGGDTHDCRPGSDVRGVIKRNFRGGRLNSLSRVHVPYFIHNPLGCGIAGVYAAEPTREAVFEALYARRVYALVGGRIRLEFSVDGHLMGEEIEVDADHRPEIAVRVEGDEAVDRVEVVRDGRVIHRVLDRGRMVSFRFVDEEKPQRTVSHYYVRVVQVNGARAWSSPVWVTRGDLAESRVTCRVVDGGLELGCAGARPPGSVDLLFFREHPFRRSSPTSLEGVETGCAVWAETGTDGEITLRIRFKSRRPANFRGYLRISGAADYFVEPVGFAVAKYGGDLFTDDYMGFVEWDVTPSSHLNPLDASDVKGLDISVEINPFREARIELDVLQDGERRPRHMYVFDTPVDRLPVEVILYDPARAVSKTRVKLDPSRVKRIAAGKGYVLIYPSHYTSKGAGYVLLKKQR